MFCTRFFISHAISVSLLDLSLRSSSGHDTAVFSCQLTCRCGSLSISTTGASHQPIFRTTTSTTWNMTEHMSHNLSPSQQEGHKFNVGIRSDHGNGAMVLDVVAIESPSELVTYSRTVLRSTSPPSTTTAAAARFWISNNNSHPGASASLWGHITASPIINSSLCRDANSHSWYKERVYDFAAIWLCTVLFDRIHWW